MGLTISLNLPMGLTMSSSVVHVENVRIGIITEESLSESI